MSRRMSGRAMASVFVFVLLVVIVGTAVEFLRSMWPLLVLGAIVIVVVAAVHSSTESKKRRAYLFNKYGDDDIVEKILSRTIWQGQTDVQLVDTLGAPQEIDNKALKTMKREVWKYGRINKRTFGLRITLENDVVVGWEQRG